MSLRTLMNRPCTIVYRDTGTETDDYGDPVVTETTVETSCELQQKTREEPPLEGETSVTEWNVYFWDISLELYTADALIVDGDTYELVGIPWVADSGSSAVRHIEATAKLSKRGTGS